MIRHVCDLAPQFHLVQGADDNTTVALAGSRVYLWRDVDHCESSARVACSRRPHPSLRQDSGASTRITAKPTRVNMTITDRGDSSRRARHGSIHAGLTARVSFTVLCEG